MLEQIALITNVTLPANYVIIWYVIYCDENRNKRWDSQLKSIINESHEMKENNKDLVIFILDMQDLN